MSYTPFGGVYPEDDRGPGRLNRDGVGYQWVFRNGQVHCGIWVTERTFSGYYYGVRVA